MIELKLLSEEEIGYQDREYIKLLCKAQAKETVAQIVSLFDDKTHRANDDEIARLGQCRRIIESLRELAEGKE